MHFRMSLLAVALLFPVSLVRGQQSAQKKPLDIYFLDTEGGQATLFVSPSGQSMLVDTGFPGNQGAPPAEANAPGITRDADRIIGLLDSKTEKAERGERVDKHLLITRCGVEIAPDQ